MTDLTENNKSVPSNDILDELKLKELYSIIYKGKKFVGYVTVALSLIGLLFSLTLPNIYQSKSILSPTGEKNELFSSLRGLGGLATLTGINISGSDGATVQIQALEKLKSLSFFTDSILPNIYLPDLMAIKSWDSKENRILHDLEKFNKEPPSAQKSYQVFKEIIRISNNPDTGLMTLTVQHHSPFIAKQWNELIVKELNNYFRTKDKLQAQAAVNYLNNQIAQTNYSEVKQSIAEIIKQKTQQLTLAEVSEFYVFDFIDPPVVMEQKSSPNRMMIFFISVIIGLILGSLIVLMRHFRESEKF